MSPHTGEPRFAFEKQDRESTGYARAFNTEGKKKNSA